MNRRIPSFTIIEMIMAMLISSVVIGIVYYIFLLLNHQFAGYQDRSAVINEYLLFQKALQTDMERADAIEYPSEKVLVLRRSVDDQPVQYDFYDNFIVRTIGDYRDSFSIQNGGCVVTRVNDSTALVEKLVLNTNMAGEHVSPVFKKQYSASQLMKSENHE